MKTWLPLLIFLAIISASCNKISNSGTGEYSGLIPFKNSDDKVGFLDSKGNIVINPQFQSARLFYEGYSMVENFESKHGYIDQGGNYSINPQFKEATSFSEGLAAVVLPEGKCQYIDPTGKIVFTLEGASKCTVFKEGLAAFEQDDKFGFINKTGEVVIQPQFDSVLLFSEGLCPVLVKSKDENNWGYINKKGEIVINPQFRSAYSLSEGLGLVSDGTNHGFIDPTGKYVINPQFKQASTFMNGLAIIMQGDQYGYIDKKGKIVINPQFDMANWFSANGIACVKSGDKYGYINKAGKYVINPQFENALPFTAGLSLAGNGEKYGIIDKSGKYITNPQFDIHYTYHMAQYAHLLWDGVRSDYFDKSSIINKIVEGTTENTFKGWGFDNTFENIKSKHESQAQYVRVVRDWATVEDDMALNKYLSCNKVNYKFDALLSEQVPVYRTEQRYNYYQGGYVNEQVLDRYETKENMQARLALVAYFYELKDKAKGKEELIARGVIEEFKNKIGGTVVETYHDQQGTQMPIYEICDSANYPGCIKVGYRPSRVEVWTEFMYPVGD